MAEQEWAITSAKEARGPAESNEATGGRNSETELAMSYCPRCSVRLTARSCKLICPGCGYYMSCSDFY
jgi:hypothetical protein